MGIMPIPKLLFSMSVPMMLSMIVQSVYNIVDSMFVAHINENALTALSLVFPFQIFMIGISVGTGVGVNALLSRSLGEKNQKNADLTAKNGIFLAVVFSIVFAIVGILFGKQFILAQTSDPQIVKYSLEYLNVITIFSFGTFMQMMFERLLQATGKTVLSMITQIVGAVTNLILDPIMIFGLLGFPALGVKGAAIATVIGQSLAGLLALYFNIKKNDDINISLKGFKPDFRIIKTIFSVGFPSILMQTIGSFLTYFINKFLISFTPTAVSVYGIYFRLQSFVFMPVFGLNNGMVPIIAYNYGARNKKRILDTIKLSIITAVLIMLTGLAIFQTIPAQLLALFDASEEMLAIGVPALRIISLSFIFAGFSIICGSVFQALGNGFLSLIISITRQLIFILPLVYILGHFFGLSAVWFSIPIAEISSLILSIIFLRYILRKKVSIME
ncbi:MAG TPA: MATE family efflux transporter [Clostridiales bacterium]|nr:MATE family efflux transporter [Clostridiales bacterium]